MLNRRDAMNIASKLNAAIKNGKRHQWAKFSIDNQTRKFSIRYSAKSNHAHLVSDLKLPLSKIQQLAKCNMTADQYYETQRTDL